MSLFKSRTFWSTVCDHEEHYDQNSLKLAALTGSYDYIISGSHSGMLRIHQPSTDVDENDVISGYKATDLLIEKSCASPILQIDTGKFVSGSQNVHIAVLHPRNMEVYSLITKEGAAVHGRQTILKLMYEHTFRRSAHNLVVGCFGGSQNRDFICVQSLDGMLTFFEQESFSFCCFLPNFLLPGPWIYIKKTDSFVTAGSTWDIESFRYKNLSEAGLNSKEGDTSGKKVEWDWKVTFGEVILDIRCVEDGLKNKESYILVLGSRHFYCLSDVGKVKFMKRLEYSSICFFTYILEDEDKIMSLVISETNTLLVYQNTTLKWSAQLSFLPIAISRAFFRNIRGALVLLSEEGKLDCCYLGTEPQMFSAPPLSAQGFDFEKTQAELITLNKMINSSFSNDLKLTNTSTERELQVTITTNPHLQMSYFNDPEKNSSNKDMCLVTIDLLPLTVVDEVQLCIFVKHPLKVSQAVEFYNNLCERTNLEVQIYVENDLEIASLDLDVILTYISNVGLPRVIRRIATLPLNLICESCSPVKESEMKMTLYSNCNAVPLSNLFPEFFGENSLTLNSNAIGFKSKSNSGSPVTVLLAKSSQRYRLQSDSSGLLTILIKYVIDRLKGSFSTREDFKLTADVSFPTTALLKCVRNHFQISQTVKLLKEDLNQLGGQYRLIQKRFISKFKDKNPTPHPNLETLMQDTYAEIIITADELDIALRKQNISQHELACVLHLVSNLIKVMDINTTVLKQLQVTFSPFVYDLENQNWEDSADAALCFLLRTVLAKSEKDKIRNAHTSFEDIKDVAKLEKHIQQVLDRIAKGGSVLEEDVPVQQQEDITAAPTQEVAAVEDLRAGLSSALSTRTRIPRGFIKE